jgi:hypothetical protein
MKIFSYFLFPTPYSLFSSQLSSNKLNLLLPSDAASANEGLKTSDIGTPKGLPHESSLDDSSW